jgi:hypothetical protein
MGIGVVVAVPLVVGGLGKKVIIILVVKEWGKPKRGVGVRIMTMAIWKVAPPAKKKIEDIRQST